MQAFLKTDRLVLRRFTAAGVEHLTLLDRDPEVMRYLTGKSTPREMVEQQVLPRILEYYASPSGLGYWAAEEKATGEFLGWFEFRPVAGGNPSTVELGYRLRRSAWGKGYATEGSRALLRKGFTELAVQRVMATTMAVNTASRRVMEKVGLRLVRLFHQSWPDPLPGSEEGEVEYALTREEWAQLQGGC